MALQPTPGPQSQLGKQSSFRLKPSALAVPEKPKVSQADMTQRKLQNDYQNLNAGVLAMSDMG